MAQQIQFSCSCGWQRSLLFGPTMSHPGDPLPAFCPSCKELRDPGEICPYCFGAMEEWDAKSCPRCQGELQRRSVAFVD